jgi:hypothetical protein
MTTEVKVRVPESANWQVQVWAHDYTFPRSPESTLVTNLLYTAKPGEEFTAYGTSTRDILVREVPL